ncbi:NAD-dependent succinate-semialdehyde dehydrogenase [uncultured Nonlabens sp.]|uniref:NAD-dependent succinate-semialdehyde dehydrogenase n=1 Tax=uncultured Nonlabens sp. TaxID=859306 RepID=UPI0026205ABF|nr:NAD-dependent succinate-semialdehyde dehydrogenase [uncultured Nonlabens sp.]
MITTINPYTGKELKEYQELSKKEIKAKLDIAQLAFEDWRDTSFEHRAAHIRAVGELLRKNTASYSKLMTNEMGKPISQSRGELEKCAWLCDFYAEKAEAYLAKEYVETEHFKSYVTFEPIGVVLAVMPWNYPFWQVFRFIVPALMAGNVGVLKHASSVMGCAELIEDIFLEAGFPEGCFQNFIIRSDKVEAIIESKIIKAVTLTGSKPAGAAVASTAAKNIKKSVLELGGNNALVVFNDADIDKTVQTCIEARFQNTGQSCIAGKRLLLQEGIADEFLEKFTDKVKALVSGDPQDEDTYIGVMAREDLAEELEDLMNSSIDKGAELHYGGSRDKAYFAPTILTDVTSDMPVFKDETFGPLMAVSTFKTELEAIKMINNSKFGLGASLFSRDIKKMESLVSQIKDGAVFINHKVASHPALPFGGTGISGFGRELSHYGIREFVNIKSVVIA